MSRILDKATLNGIEDIFRKALSNNRTRLLEHEAYDVLELAGIAAPARSFLTSADQAVTGIKGRAVCKLISPEMLHRTEYGGIRFIEATDENISATFREFAGIADKAGVEFSGMLVTEQLEIEENLPRQLILSLRQNRSFGPVVVMGAGGTGTEIYRESLKENKGLFLSRPETIRDKERVSDILARTMIYPIISGKTRISREPLIEHTRILDILNIFAELADSFSHSSDLSEFTLEELEVNPLQIIDKRVVALDALLKISKEKFEATEKDPEKIQRLLEPESVMVVGASASRKNMGRQILKNLVNSGDRIKNENILALHPNPDVTGIEGVKALNDLSELESKLDLVVITIPASDSSVSMVERIIEEELASSMILISAGFDETEGGVDYADRIKRALGRKQDESDSAPVINGPNCMGIVSGPGGYNTFFLPEYKVSYAGMHGGDSAFISQSGAFVVTMKNLMPRIDPAYMITVGNQLDLTVTDYMVTIGNEESIDTFFLYLEGFKQLDGRRFLKTASGLIESGKRIIAYKAGRTSEGARAVASHTAAMAGDYFVFKKLMAETGILIADTLDDFEDCMKIFTVLSSRAPAGNRVGIISDAGYECSSACDILGGLKLASFSDRTLAGLKENLPDIVNVKNPLDSTPSATTAEYGRCVKSIIEDPNTDCVIISNVASTATQENLPPGEGHNENIYNENSHPNTLIKLVNSTDKPAVISMNGGKIYDPAVALMEDAGLCVFRKIDRAVKAMDRFVRYSESEKGKTDHLI